MRSEHVSDENKKRFGNLISEKRKQKKLHLKDIAKFCGVSLNFISLIERGIKSPSDSVIVKLSQVLEIDEGILFQTLDRIPPSIKNNVSTAIHEHDGFKELLGELSEKVKDENLREKLYEEVYEVYLDFLKRNNLDKE
ncbi:helix-turn-helix transcriptional regulator [Paenibacillus lautus]|uniref:helix-turn-helix domain-containing protein n=1 Tax=Paenibacillus lautus TaxID=1401 RepID=UPI003D2C94E8